MSEDMIFLKAAPGRRVRDDHTLQLLAPDGEWKPRSTYWMRRLRDADVIEAQQPTARREKAKE
jgi:hypothetical protein